MGKKAAETHLFHHHQVVVLLAFLNEDVLPIDEIIGIHHLVESDLVLVDAHTIALHHLTSFALGGEDLGVDGHEIHNRDAGFKIGTVDMLLRNAFENLEEGLLVELHQSILSGLAKEDVGGFDGSVEGFLRVYHHRDFFGKTLLQYSTARILLMFFDQGIDSLFLQRGEDLDVLLGILVTDVEPELVELVRRGAFRVEPDVAALRLAGLRAVSLGEQAASQSEGLVL